jgi:hypothetical protein
MRRAVDLDDAWSSKRVSPRQPLIQGCQCPEAQNPARQYGAWVWQHSALRSEPLHGGHPRSGGDLALGCEPERGSRLSWRRRASYSTLCWEVSAWACMHAVRTYALRLQGFPQVSRCRRDGIPIRGRIWRSARRAKTDLDWLGARWRDLYQRRGNVSGFCRMVRLRLPSLRFLCPARVQPDVQLCLRTGSLS